MTIEESIKKNPTPFEEIMDTKAPEIKAALKELSSQLDIIINGAIKEYAAETGAEVDMSAIPSYKAMNKIITGKLDKIIGEHIKEKRKDL
jgi:putative sterol carrier protein